MLRELSEKWLCKDEAKLIQLEGLFYRGRREVTSAKGISFKPKLATL